MSTLTDQILNGPDQDFVQDLFYYPPLNTVPTGQTPNQPVQDYLQDPFNHPTTSQTPNEPVQGDLEDPFYPPLVQTSDQKRMCCSCHGFEHVQPTKVEYINLGDGRYLCPRCLSVSLTEPKQLEPVIRQVHSFFDDYLKLPVKKNIPIFFVDENEMHRHDGDAHHVKRCIRRGADLEVVTETKKVKGNKVAAIILLFGLPKHIVGAALVHEMVHAWIRLQGLRLRDWFFKWKIGVEEGLCVAASYEWLKYTTGDYDPSYTEKEAEIVERLRTYFKSNMKECRFSLYPAEFRTAKCAFKKYGVKPTLKHFARTRKILK
ncbi:hypothetical protein RHSIM_Rhsim01G0128000 [Rhododendron simsii]|uniref:Protein DA1-like domain-containing protein n=1 Tax=Rhododendron simsii TaxID=118357 RepID=A0A834HFI3_RHOSS|nr:hypothetical protein RHSIM_Rhsim01G0128000 [Rhododendron simsii]